jgi:hypothetical protein
MFSVRYTYEEALRRIRKAEETRAVELDLSGWKWKWLTELAELTRLPPKLGTPHLCPITQPLRVQEAQRFILAGNSHFASVAQPRRVQEAQRSIPAGNSDFAPAIRTSLRGSKIGWRKRG